MVQLADGPKRIKIRKQVAAIPLTRDDEGRLMVMLITSRETRRLIVPKGWAMKGRKDHRAAAIEAREEAGLIGRVHRKPVGTYAYWKRMPDRFVYCVVKVYRLDVTGQLKTWREQGQRRRVWLLPEDAVERVDEPGLGPLIREIAARADERPARDPKGGRPASRPPTRASPDPGETGINSPQVALTTGRKAKR